MANKYRMPDFRKLYPEADERVIAVLETTERKIKPDLRPQNGTHHLRW